MDNPVVHFEIAGRDGKRLEEFYSKLFGWKIERKEAGGSPYGLIQTDRDDLTGGIRHEPEGDPEVVLYIRVPVLTDAVEAARRLGGEVRIPPMTAGGLTFALIRDPEGNRVGMIQKKS